MKSSKSEIFFSNIVFAKLLQKTGAILRLFGLDFPFEMQSAS